MAAKRNAAIGVFDSGLGGLTVVKEIIRAIPGERVIYFGDTARVPYGTKSKETIVQYSMENTRALLKHKVKVVVVACNSSSSYAIPALRKKFRVPVLGVIQPGARRAAEVSRRKRIGVIATMATVESGSYTRAVREFCRPARIHEKACPLFVPLVEAGWAERKVTLDTAGEYCKELKRKKIDTLILGCTHYPLLKKVLRKTFGKGVVLVDSAKQVAQEVRALLEKEDLLAGRKKPVRHKFIITDRPQEFRRIARNFLGRDIDNIQYCKTYV